MESTVITDAVSDVVTQGGVTVTEFFYKGWLGLLAEEGRISLWIWAVAIVLCALMGYLLGSINFAVVISRVKFHDDIRRHGSGNAGATNMTRTYGKAAGVATLMGDILKSVVTVLITRFLVGDVWAYLAGMSCALGHAFPCYYRFKGGKGVAVTAAMALVLEPLAFLAIFLIFFVVVGFTKYVSLGSISAAFFFPLILYNIVSSRFGHGDLRVIFAFVVCALVVWLHRENIKRLLAGTENKLDLKKGKRDEKKEQK